MSIQPKEIRAVIQKSPLSSAQFLLEVLKLQMNANQLLASIRKKCNLFSLNFSGFHKTDDCHSLSCPPSVWSYHPPSAMDHAQKLL